MNDFSDMVLTFTYEEMSEHNKQIRAEVIDECIDEIKERKNWDNKMYALAIKHCIEVFEKLKEKKC